MTVGNIPIRFFVENDFDEIQGAHRRGELYEAEELAIIGRHFAGGTFVDIGANVGNHSVYAAKVLKADKVIAFEPNPLAADLFEINSALNDCRGCLSLYRVGLSDSDGTARPTPEANNLGGTRLERDPEGSLPIRCGDDFLKEEDLGFIKVDVEGSELSVLRGLSETIARSRPPLFAEVEDTNIDAFESYCASIGYSIREEYRRYSDATNFLVLPQGRESSQSPLGSAALGARP
jgi:FkbM family methyltransferase